MTPPVRRDHQLQAQRLEISTDIRRLRRLGKAAAQSNGRVPDHILDEIVRLEGRLAELRWVGWLAGIDADEDAEVGT